MQREIRLGTEGFRGIIGREFTFANLHRLAEAYGRYLLERGGGRVVVGHDTRFQAQAFAQALAAHLGQMGLEAHLLPGPVPTPLLSFAVRQLEAAGGAMVTASHNPPEYLGLKFKDPSGGPIAPEEARRIEALVPEEARESQGPYRVSELRGAYLEALAQLVNLPALERLAQEHPGFTLFHDAMGGAGGGLLRRFFAHVGLPLRLVELRAEPHPLFYGVNPEPIPRNLAATLEALAPASPPSFAVVTDGDADRVGVVLAGGHYFNPHQALAVLAHHRFLQGRRGRVVKNFAVSWILDRLGARLGFEVQTTPIGFKWIKVEFLRGDVLIGGEESGGIGFPEHLPERDGLLAGLLL
ncbi:MAG: phosphoglucomutase/phosphomannomutase family protein, partial [Meiothermus sp.]